MSGTTPSTHADGACAAWAPETDLTIQHAATLWQSARDRRPFGGNIDLSAIGRIDTAGVQLLMALRALYQRDGAAWRIVGCSPAVLDTIGLLGGATALGLSSDGQMATEEKAS